MPRLRGNEVAQALGIHKATVSRQARAWGLLGADKTIDLDEYRARRERELNPLMAREAEQPAAPPAGSVQLAAADLKRTQSALLQLKLDREAGKQFSAEDVLSAVGEAGGLLRALLGAVPAKLAVELARSTDPDEIERTLATALDQVLGEYDAALAKAVADDTDEDTEGT
jgi:hypothetical protein